MTDLLSPPTNLDLGALLARLGEAARAWRFDVAPNPAVGAALLSPSGELLAEGYHRVWGGPHAEVECLEVARAKGLDREAFHTLAVTLEPCSSTGKTGPCTEAILAAGVRRVVVGSLDPDPRHRGAGLRLLRERGLEVEFRQGASPLERVSPHFLRWLDQERLRRPRPWLIAKWAQTLSGQLQPPEHVGQGRWISSPESLSDLQRLRARVDGILTGVGTVTADDPRLSVRPPGQTARPPIRVVVDTHLTTPATARLFAPPGPNESAGAVHILTVAGASAGRHRALLEAGAKVHGLHPSRDGRVDLRDTLTWLWNAGARRVLLESGPRLLESVLRAGFADQLRIYTGDVRGGRGDSLAGVLGELDLEGRGDRECGPDSVLEAFVVGVRRR